MVLATPDSKARICWVRRASLTAKSVGRASVSSSEFVWSEFVPPSTPASAWRAVRTTLLYGCCAVSEQPAVWVWKRHIQERGSFAPKRSRIVFDHTRRAARNLAISSKKSLCELKKNDSRGANSSTGRPASIPYFTYSTPSRSVNASSWSAVEPASRMWYPEIEIVFQRGTFFAQKENWSVTRRIDG